MKKKFLTSLVCVFLAGGCASTGQLKKIESDGERNEKMLRNTEQRVRNLEQEVAVLGNRVNYLNDRVYEVRTSGGRKTGMKVMPVDARTDVPAPRKIPVSKAQANSAASSAAPRPAQKAAGPSGSLGTTAPDLTPAALPPVEAPAPLLPEPEQKTVNPRTTSPAAPMPSRSVPSPSAAGSDSVPVPSLPPSDLPLPPEHPALPPAAIPVPEPAAASATPRTQAPSVPSAISDSAAGEARTKDAAALPPKTEQGEEAAYKAALNLAMSGRSAEGIARFRDFLRQYPNGRYAANAEYWIGECLYAQRNYKDALAQFQLVNTQYAAHHKNADALLKAGMTLNRLGDKQGAAEKYRTLLTAFPNSEAAKRVRDLGLAR
ncbi:MAG: tol-pal system protein YbgF [Desulfovibrio sp.]|jgi:tol-pal system protein YbgF|nr:tol-pal system protein YbgF [Desulfovibrio sp.]